MIARQLEDNPSWSPLSNEQSSQVTSKLSQVHFRHWGDAFVMRTHLGQQEYKILNRLSYQVCVLELNAVQMTSAVNDDHWQIVHSLFERHAFRSFVDLDKQRFVVLFFDAVQFDCSNGQAVRKERLQQIASKLETILNRKGDCKYDVSMGVSAPHRGFRAFQTAYAEAKAVA